MVFEWASIEKDESLNLNRARSPRLLPVATPVDIQGFVDEEKYHRQGYQGQARPKDVRQQVREPCLLGRWKTAR